MSDHAPLLDRRDARAIKQVARDLAVSVETLPVGSGLLTVAPVSLLLQLRDAFGDEGMADVWAVIDGPALRALKPAAGLRSIDDELAAVWAVAERRQRRETILREREANGRAKAAAKPARDDPPRAAEAVATPHADEIKAALATLGMQPHELAERLGISRSAVTNWCNGRNLVADRNLIAIRALVAERGAAG
jgi:DNA-binding transcriptional regulator YiaG